MFQPSKGHTLHRLTAMLAAHLRALNNQTIERGVIGGVGIVVHGGDVLNQQKVQRNGL
jgi:hypothetical protein